MLQELKTAQDKFNFTIMNRNITISNNANIFFSAEWTIFGETTIHQLVPAHVLYEAIDNFPSNVIMKTQQPPVSIPSKFRNGFELHLFNEVFYGLDESFAKYFNFSEICFKNIVIGTNEYSGLWFCPLMFDGLHKHIVSRFTR